MKILFTGCHYCYTIFGIARFLRRYRFAPCRKQKYVIKGQTKSSHSPQCCKPFFSQHDFTGQLSAQKGLSIFTHPLQPIDSRKLQSLHRSPHLDSIILRFLLLRTAVPAALAFPSSGRSLQTVQMLPDSSRKQNIPQGLYKCRRCRPKSRASAP